MIYKSITFSSLDRMTKFLSGHGITKEQIVSILTYQQTLTLIYIEL